MGVIRPLIDQFSIKYSNIKCSFRIDSHHIHKNMNVEFDKMFNGEWLVLLHGSNFLLFI